MLQARVVKLEGVDGLCLVMAPPGQLPEELVVDFDRVADHPELDKRGTITYRLEPSTSEDPRPVYQEMFDEG